MAVSLNHCDDIYKPPSQFSVHIIVGKFEILKQTLNLKNLQTSLSEISLGSARFCLHTLHFLLAGLFDSGYARLQLLFDLRYATQLLSDSRYARAQLLFGILESEQFCIGSIPTWKICY